MAKPHRVGVRIGRGGRIRRMVGVACAVMLAITAAPSTANASAHAQTPLPCPVITTNQTGTHGGYFYAFWKDTGNATMTLGPQGNYSTRWGGINNWFAGKGWAVGGRRTFTYHGTFHPGGNSYLALYGYTTNPYVEYYILENWGTYRPSGTYLGTLYSEGGVYEIHRVRRIGIPGSMPYDQFFSIRLQKRSSGTINTGDHFDAWARVGMNLGTTMGYMIMATEGYQSSGWSNITVDSTTPEPPQCSDISIETRENPAEIRPGSAGRISVERLRRAG